ncbi:hypothetical protein AURDEDRAFT_158717 [Auricularia subglabra TFB-10046 SS5]|nr:hypothetical protein AURDEDRAFT_158717 [Auricularia subglabra TFB-10046 SS5]
MSIPSRKHRDDSPLDVEAASVLLRMSSKSKGAKKAKSKTPEPPRVPPPTRATSPCPSPSSSPGLKWLAPLTPMDFAALTLSDSSPEASPREADDVRYFFLPPVTPLDFQHETSDLWRAPDADPAANSDSAAVSDSGAEQSLAHRARVRRKPRGSICDGRGKGSDDGDAGQSADVESPEESEEKEVESA